MCYYRCLPCASPLLVMAQSNNDDLYFVPSKEKAGSQKDSCEEGTGKKVVTTNIYTSPGTTVVVQDRKGNKRDMRDVDEYNRRYDAKDNEFANGGRYIIRKRKSCLRSGW